MYTHPFLISWNVWNNAFSYEIRQRKELFVPNLKHIQDIHEVALWDQVTFADVDFKGVLREYSGLKNLYQMYWKGIPLFLFDNHNHAYFFWHLAKDKWIIWSGNTLYHIDEHADTRVPKRFLTPIETNDLQKIFEYTNFELNVGNYIVPAQNDGLITKLIQIRSESEVESVLAKLPHNRDASIILNLDLDFFEPNLDYIDYHLKKRVILELASCAKIITVASSPYFIEQELALKVFTDIFTISS